MVGSKEGESGKVKGGFSGQEEESGRMRGMVGSREGESGKVKGWFSRQEEESARIKITRQSSERK